MIKIIKISYFVPSMNFQEVIPYPDYQPRYRDHDIALLKLAHSIMFKSNIWPACLYPENDFQRKTLIIAGFGRTDVADSECSNSSIELKLDLKYVARFFISN
jgi:Trypsin